MPVITIDGVKIEAQPGKTIIEACLENGITIPHFCWHPSLSVAGNCRMCLVNVGSQKKSPEGTLEVDGEGNPVIMWMPKLQIACATPISDGMFVSTKDDKTLTAQNSVMEFILINHPLDCPICDEAGQCKLQEYAYKFSKGESRFDDIKNHKDKRVAWGPQVMFDGERCISCSRCIRFATEIANQPVLSFVQRGDHVTIETFEGTQFDSPYSMNVIDICPVGALTSIDFRFKARVWDMSFNDSVCPGCSRGCNIKVGVRDNEILRLEPRANPIVNKYWMCDAGRTTQYKWVNANRVSGSYIRSDKGLVLADADTAYTAIAKAIKQYKSDEVMIVVGGMLSNEDVYTVKKLASEVIHTNRLVVVERTDTGFADSFLRTADRNANSHGIASLGITSIKPNEIADYISKNHIKALLVLGDEIIRGDEAILSAVKSLSFFALATFNECQSTEIANVIIGSATYAESEGTYTNITDRVQHFTPAIVTKENMRIMGMKMSRLDKFGAQNDRWTQGDKRDCKQHWRIAQGIAEALGTNFGYKNSESVFDDIVKHVTGYNHMSYDALDSHLGLTLNHAQHPESLGVIYESHTLKPN